MDEDTRLGNTEELAKLTGLAIATAESTLEVKLTSINSKSTQYENYLLSKTVILGILFDHVFTSHSNYIEARNIYREIKREINN